MWEKDKKAKSLTIATESQQITSKIVVFIQAYYLDYIIYKPGETAKTTEKHCL